MREMFSKQELMDIELENGYSYFKDYKVLKLDTETLFYNSLVDTSYMSKLMVCKPR